MRSPASENSIARSEFVFELYSFSKKKAEDDDEHEDEESLD